MVPLRSNLHLLGIAVVVVFAIVLDALLFLYRPAGAFEILLVTDGVILVGLAADAILRLRQRSIDSNLFRRLAESSPLASPSPEIPQAEEPGSQRNETEIVYHDSPEGLEFPAFVCTCGHLHQFLCLTCNMTAEKARQAKGTKWFEWSSDMKEVDY